MLLNRHTLSAGLLGVFALLLAPVGHDPSAWTRALQNAAHGPLFALVAAGALLWLRATRPSLSALKQYLLALLIAVLIGGLGEAAQALLTATRRAEWDDLLTDALGAAAGLGVVSLLEPALRVSPRAKRWLVLPALVIATCAIALPLGTLGLAYQQRRAQLPDLLTWRSAYGLRFALGSEARLQAVRVSDAPGEYALQITPLPQARWPGIALEEPWPDWSRYQALEITVFNPHATVLEFNVRIDDAQHNRRYEDRFNHSFRAPARQTTTERISIDAIQHGPTQRQLDVGRISFLAIFQDGHQQPKPFLLQRLQLAP